MKPESFMKRIGDGPWMHLLASYEPDNIWEVDHEAMRSNLRFMIDKGAKVVDATSTAGEWGFMTDEERKECWKDLVEVGKGKVLCIAGNGHSSTKKAIEMTKFGEEIGMDGMMTIGPFWQTPDEEGVYQHYKKIAESTSLGVMVYNSSAFTHKANVTPDLMGRLARIPNIVGIKECGRDMAQWLAHIRMMEERGKVVVCGMEEMFYVIGALTSDVVVSCTTATGTWDPSSPIELYEAVRKKEIAAITTWFKKNAPYADFLQHVGVPRNQAALKGGLDLVEGVQGGAVRPPALPLTDLQLQELRNILQARGLALKSTTPKHVLTDVVKEGPQAS